MESGTVGGLVRGARAGDRAAWDDLVRRYAGLVHAVCRCHGLADADAEAVTRVVWLRTAEHLAGLRSPESVGPWIAAVARGESLRALRAAGRIPPVPGVVLPDPARTGDDGPDLGPAPGDSGDAAGLPDGGDSVDPAGPPEAGDSVDPAGLPDAGDPAGPPARRLLGALARLDHDGQRLLRLLAARPRPDDEEVGAALDLPVDAVGPARDRSLSRLRALAAHPGPPRAGG